MSQDPLAAALARTFRPRERLARPSRGQVLLALGILAVQVAVAASMPSADGRALDPIGWSLLVASALLVGVCHWAPGWGLIAMLGLVLPYHGMNFVHSGVVPASLFALYCFAAAGPPRRTFAGIALILGAQVCVMLSSGQVKAIGDMLRVSGWLVACVLVGESVRIHRNYVAAIVERAERAERTREEEAARRVAQERLRIARDLHDLLAHSITLIGVQTSVAAHVLVADPDRLDREAVAKALDGISDTCRDARAELRTTLEVLRADEAEGHGPLPGLSGLPDLARAATGAGAHVELTVHDSAPAASPPAAVSAAAYRIVQEAFTNAVRHAGDAVRIRAVVEAAEGGLRVSVRDDGGGPRGQDQETPSGEGGFGIVGMRERARSVGGTLEAGPAESDGPGFQVTAHLPLAPAVRREATA
ncbi:sensor histidine kinase [Streptomyces sp. NPDC048172]|uniref:sensor histidine kinase n=1 Tax=Streptomyces sp. NPDC048172 TaxID=3365505 RepID=UPI003724469B